MVGKNRKNKISEDFGAGEIILKVKLKKQDGRF